jgi:hypothetical protein
LAGPAKSFDQGDAAADAGKEDAKGLFTHSRILHILHA